MKKPKYVWEEFIAACGGPPRNIHVVPKALKTASQDFQLDTKPDLLLFINANEFAEVTFSNSDVWRDPPVEYSGCVVDSYTFVAFWKYGYVAFMQRQDEREKWVIKSFHAPRHEVPLYSDTPFRYLLGENQALPRGDDDER